MSKRFNNASEHPLCWPEGFPRHNRNESSRFKTTLAKALDNVTDELQRFASDSGKKIDDLIVSSNYSLTKTRPSDPGVAVYFTWDSERTCIPVDRYDRIECNLQAIFHCLNADRTKLRHGGINLVKAAFRGYAALPPATDDWREILNLKPDCTLTQAKTAYRQLIKQHHPDNGGNKEQAAKINDAWGRAKEELQ